MLTSIICAPLSTCCRAISSARLVVAGQDQLRELARAGDVGALARRWRRCCPGPMVSGSSPLSRQARCGTGPLPRRQAAHRVGDRPDVRRRGAAAAAHEVHQPAARRTRGAPPPCTPASRRTRRTRSAGRRWGARSRSTGATRESSWTYCRSACAPSAQLSPTLSGRRVRHRVPERLGGLARERPPARVGDRARDHDRQPLPEPLEQRLDREERGLGVERVEDGLDQEQVGPAVDQAARAPRCRSPPARRT